MIAIIQRHGQTGKADTDPERRLTDKGQQQARTMEGKLRERGLSPAALVLSSVAPRAVETAGVTEQSVIEVAELYLPGGEDLEILNDLGKRLGYAPLRAFLATDTTGAIERWGATAHRAVLSEIERAGVTEGSVRVVCHATISNLLALALVGDKNAVSRDRILDLAVPEGGCIVIYENGEIEITEP